MNSSTEFSVDLAGSVFVGDKETDIQAGVAAGVGCNLLYRPLDSERPSYNAATAVIGSLAEASAALRCATALATRQ